MKIKNVLLFMLLLLISKISLGQERKITFQPDYKMYLKVSDIYKADKDNILKKEGRFYKETDSVECRKLGDYYWLKFACYKDDRGFKMGRVIAIDKEFSKVQFVGDIVAQMGGFYGIYYTVDYGLYIFCGQLFYIGDHEEVDYIEGKIGYDKIRVIDIDRLKIMKEITLEHGAWWHDIITNGDTLIIELQPMKLRRNHAYEFRWLFREETMKYFIEDDGSKIRLLFDKDFNYIRKIKLE